MRLPLARYLSSITSEVLLNNCGEFLQSVIYLPMTTWIFISFLSFTGFAALLNWSITLRDELGSSEGFFLCGGSLTYPIIVGSSPAAKGL